MIPVEALVLVVILAYLTFGAPLIWFCIYGLDKWSPIDNGRDDGED